MRGTSPLNLGGWAHPWPPTFCVAVLARRTSPSSPDRFRRTPGVRAARHLSLGASCRRCYARPAALGQGAVPKTQRSLGGPTLGRPFSSSGSQSRSWPGIITHRLSPLSNSRRGLWSPLAAPQSQVQPAQSYVVDNETAQQCTQPTRRVGSVPLQQLSGGRACGFSCHESATS